LGNVNIRTWRSKYSAAQDQKRHGRQRKRVEPYAD